MLFRSLKYKDEIALSTLLLSLTIQKINAAVMASRVYATGQVQSEPTPEKDGEDTNPQPN